MSKIGNQALKVPSNLTIKIVDNLLEISSKLGKITHKVDSRFYPELIENSQIKIKPKVSKPLSMDKEFKSIWGTEHRLLKNNLEGLSKGYRIALNLKGVGFKGSIINNTLILKLGYSHDIFYNIPKNVIIKCPKQDKIVIFGINKTDVTSIAAKLKLLKKRDPYKGKGILFENEVIVLKEGKKK